MGEIVVGDFGDVVGGRGRGNKGDDLDDVRTLLVPAGDSVPAEPGGDRG